jgi:hypothetical protein
LRIHPDDKEALRILTGYGIESLQRRKCSYTDKPKTEIRICTEGYLNDSYKKKDIYISLQVALLFRKLGLNGWVIPEGTLKRALDEEVEFHQEILMTVPFLDLKETNLHCSDFEKKNPSLLNRLSFGWLG